MNRHQAHNSFFLRFSRQPKQTHTKWTLMHANEKRGEPNRKHSSVVDCHLRLVFRCNLVTYKLCCWHSRSHAWTLTTVRTSKKSIRRELNVLRFGLNKNEMFAIMTMHKRQTHIAINRSYFYSTRCSHAFANIFVRLSFAICDSDHL